MKPPLAFTNLNREDTLQALSSSHFDLVIIGGGITGAGIALDAASRGLKAVLLEKGDFASGTSSKSTKLIHGGLRYLKQFDFRLVKEVGSERAIVHRLAPHLVLPEKMLLPLMEKGSYGKWLTSLGLKVYDLLAQVDGEDQRRMLDREEALEMEPMLPGEYLKGAGYYAEYRTDDARLTIENIKTSLQYGARALNYTEVLDFLYESGQIAGVRARDGHTGTEFSVRARYVISAAGPWVDELRGLNHSEKGKHLLLTKGVHLVFPYHKLPVRQAIYFEVRDGRMIFAIPRGKVTYVGTTDTLYEKGKDKDEVHADRADADYLLSALNDTFPGIHLRVDHIESSWAGLRPLIHEEGKSVGELSRKDEIFISPTGLISIAGGKLTGYRKMAEKVVNQLAAIMEEDSGIGLKSCQTERIPLCGNGFDDFSEVTSYVEEVYAQIQDHGLSEYDAWYLVTTYGKQTESILAGALFAPGDPSSGLLMAELQFCLQYELVYHPLDFLIRRTGRVYFDIESVRKGAEQVLREVGTYFHSSEAQLARWRKDIDAALRRHSEFPPESFNPVSQPGP